MNGNYCRIARSGRWNCITCTAIRSNNKTCHRPSAPNSASYPQRFVSTFNVGAPSHGSHLRDEIGEERTNGVLGEEIGAFEPKHSNTAREAIADNWNGREGR